MAVGQPERNLPAVTMKTAATSTWTPPESYESQPVQEVEFDALSKCATPPSGPSLTTGQAEESNHKVARLKSVTSSLIKRTSLKEALAAPSNSFPVGVIQLFSPNRHLS
jgi:hypothetical protein